MERTRITFERATAHPGEMVRGVVMMESPRDVRASSFDVRAEGIERVPVVVSVSHIGEPAVQERRAFEIPLLLEILHVPVGFGRGDDGSILLPKGVYFLGFSFRVPEERADRFPDPQSISELHLKVVLTDTTGIEVETTAVLPAQAPAPGTPREQPRRLALL